MENKIYQYSFKRDDNYNLSDGDEYKTDLLTKDLFKYPEQSTFSCGVAKVQIGNSPPVGKRLEMINYAMKNICTTEVYKKLLIHRIPDT